MEWLIKHWWILVLVFFGGGDYQRDQRSGTALTTKNSLTTNPICRRTVILTINGTMTTTGPKHDQSKKP